ncbi:MAG: ankyrin repeat domain-containing protein [Chlamydiales bacterium]
MADAKARVEGLPACLREGNFSGANRHLDKLEAGATKLDVNELDDKKNTLLMLAIIGGKGHSISEEEILHILKRLLDLGVDINQMNGREETALSLAVNGNYPCIVGYLLLEAKVDTKKSTTRSGNTILHIAAEANANLEIVQLLLRFSASELLNHRNLNNQLPLHLVKKPDVCTAFCNAASNTLTPETIAQLRKHYGRIGGGDYREMSRILDCYDPAVTPPPVPKNLQQRSNELWNTLSEYFIQPIAVHVGEAIAEIAIAGIAQRKEKMQQPSPTSSTEGKVVNSSIIPPSTSSRAKPSEESLEERTSKPLRASKILSEKLILETKISSINCIFHDSLLPLSKRSQPLFFAINKINKILNTSFNFPETHLNLERDRSLKSYTDQELRFKHPFFKTLNEHIDFLAENENKDPDIGRIKMHYIEYIVKICTSRGKLRWGFLQGDVRLLAYVHALPVCLEISQREGKDIASLNSLNQLVRNNSYGANAVIEINGVFYKRKEINPLFPGIAQAAYELAIRSVGGDPPPFLLVKLDNIIVLGGKRISHIFQASKEVSGISLVDFLNNTPHLLDTISRFTQGFILDLIFLPRDLRTDNIQVAGEMRAVDYDSGFGPAIEDGYLKCRTIRLLLDQPMSQPFDADYANYLLNTNINDLMIDWIASLAKYNDSLQILLEHNLFTQAEFQEFSLPITISSDAISHIYKTLSYIKKLLRKGEIRTTKDSNIEICQEPARSSSLDIEEASKGSHTFSQNTTISMHRIVNRQTPRKYRIKNHWDLLQEIQPTLYRIYRALVKKHPKPIEAQAILFTDVGYPKLSDLEQSLQEYLTTSLEPQCNLSYKRPTPPFNALQVWMQSIFKQISAKQQENIISKISLLFNDVRNIELSNLKIDNESLVRLINQFKNIKELKLSNSNVSLLTLITILNNKPDLILTITDSLSLEPNECEDNNLKELIQFARIYERSLNFLIHNTKCSIDQTQINETLIKTISHRTYKFAKAIIDLYETEIDFPYVLNMLVESVFTSKETENRLGNIETLPNSSSVSSDQIESLGLIPFSNDDSKTPSTSLAEPSCSSNDMDESKSHSYRHNLVELPISCIPPQLPKDFNHEENIIRNCEMTYYQSFLTAEKPVKKSYYLVKLAGLSCKRGNYIRAIILLNKAYTIFPHEKSAIWIERLKNKMIKCIINNPQYIPRIESYRTKLDKIQKKCLIEGIKNDLSIEEILDSLSKKYQELLAKLLNDCIKCFGEPPSKPFCLIGLPSISFDEIYPIADFKLVFLTEEKTKEAITYFCLVARLMETMIACFWGTQLKMFPHIDKKNNQQKSIVSELNENIFESQNISELSSNGLCFKINFNNR